MIILSSGMIIMISGMIINTLNMIKAERIKLVQNLMEAKRTITLNFTGSNREQRILVRSLGLIGIDLFAKDRSTLRAVPLTELSATLSYAQFA